MLSFLRRAVVAAVLAVACCAASAAAADAATLVNAGGTLTYTGTDARSDLGIVQTAPDTVRFERAPFDADPITTTDCTTTDGGTTFSCPGVTRVVATGAGGSDSIDAGGLTSIPATLDGGAGNEFLSGGGANDTVSGGAGADFVIGGRANDTVDGGDGDDFASGGEGDDRVLGGAGDDDFSGEPGNDDYSGGTGVDSAEVSTAGPSPRPNANVILDDQADDSLSGTGGEADNVRADVEGVVGEGFLAEGGNDTFIGNAGANTLFGGDGNDTLDGGAGNDVLSGGDEDDTIRARDGFADFVNCGAGNDTTEVDTLDRVEDCENVQRADVGNANDVPEDRAPTVTFTSPASGASPPTRAPTVLTADAQDDRGISAVLFIDDERIVCSDAIAPYTCAYSPRGEDVGRNTLAVVAVDTAQQTASAFRAVNVDRFAPAGITGAVTPARDRRAPYRFRSSGRVRLPAGVTPAQACGDGQVSIQVKAGTKTISTRRANLSRTCTFTSTVTFRDRRRFTRNGRLRFTLRFTGNEVLARTAAVARNVRTR